MKLHDLHPTEGSRHPRKRVGRGDGSGLGRTCGRGEKGQKSRSGAKLRPFFEGGQVPLFRRLPKRGFKNPDHFTFSVVNTGALDKNFSANEIVDVNSLMEKGLVGASGLDLKILGTGEISKPLTIKANKFSESAKSKIEAAGGKCEVI